MALIYPDHPAFRAKYPVIVRNGASEEIPPCAVMAISSVADNGDGKAVVTVIKPTSTFARQYLVNSPIAIPNNSSAQGYAGFLEDFGYVRFQSGTPAIGEEWGATSGQWYLTQNRPGFVVTAETATFNGQNLVYAKGYMTTQVLGKLASGTLAVDNTGTFNVLGGTPGSESSTSLQVSAFYKTGPTTLTTSDFVTIGWLHGKAYASPFVCS